MKSWRNFGIPITAVQTTPEIEVLRKHYPQVTTWIAEDDTGTAFSGSFQRIHRMAEVATETHAPALIINSDIEIHLPPDSPLALVLHTDTVPPPESLVAGIRWNHTLANRSDAAREKYGFDAFVITPVMADTLLRLELPMGKPGWDYWLPCHFLELGYSMDFIGTPMFYHREHPFAWSMDELAIGLDQMTDLYTAAPNNIGVPYRMSFPYAPSVM